jgi:hypothetical protein
MTFNLNKLLALSGIQCQIAHRTVLVFIELVSWVHCPDASIWKWVIASG